ncbi:hypothetical protein P7C70_g3905, partial [Phenoliferia sp. Uapishka_3]
MLDQELPLDLVNERLPTNLRPCPPPQPNPLPSFWTSNYSGHLKNANSTTPLPKEDVDIVIIGSGLTGSCVAAHLVDGWLEQRKRLALGEDAVGEKGLSIVVLDAREFCSGATGRNGGHLTPAPRFNFKSISEASSVDDAKRSVELEDRAAAWVIETCVAENWEDDVDLVQGGCVRFFKDQAREDAVRVQLNAAKAAGVDILACTWLSADEALRDYGATTHSALRIPGNNLFPLKFVSKIFTRAQERCSGTGLSLDLFTSAMVNSITPSKSRTSSRSSSTAARWTVKTSRGNISAHRIVHATNAYASHLLPSLASGPHCIVPTRGQVIAVTPSPSSNPRWTSAFSASESFEYFFQRKNGGPVILGGGRAFAGPRFEYGIVDDGKVSKVVGGALREYLGDQFPKWFGEEEGKFGMEWTGIMG